MSSLVRKSLVAIILALLLTSSFAVTLFILPRPSAGFAGTERTIFSSAKLLEGPTLGPDGSRIAFASAQSGTLQIWSMDPQGKHLTRLTYLDRNASTPKFSPDGRNIAFFLSGQTRHEIMVMDKDGSNIRSISGSDVANGTFYWSPDSCCIAYQAREQGGSNGIVVRDVRNGLSLFRAEGSYPTWSSDKNGEILAFIMSSPNGSSALSVVDLKQGTARNVSLSSYETVSWPAFVANNTMVAFLTASNNSWCLMTLDLGSGQTNNMLEAPPGQYEISVLNPSLTQGSIALPRPTNSSEIIFAGASTSPRMMDLYVAILGATIVVSHFFSVSYPGTVLDRVTNHSYSSIESLSWSGDGRSIIFVTSEPNSVHSIVLVSYVRPVVQSSYGSGA